MLWPDPNEFTRNDVIRGMRHFPLKHAFRDSYKYDNVLYIIAGEIVPRVTGQDWASFVDGRIMAPLGMKRCFAGKVFESEMRNLAAPHGMIDGELTVIERSRIHGDEALYAAAGGVVCSASDMVKWVKMQLGRGTAPDGTVVFSAARSREMWTPENFWAVSSRNYEWHRTHFNGYGLGWRISDVHGYKEVSHTGSLAGMRAWTLMIPELDLGIVVLSNGSNTSARNAVMHTIKYSYIEVPERDWIAEYRQLDEAAIVALHDAGFEVGVESNGTIAAPPGIDWLCISPKGAAALVQRSGDELKLVFPQAEPEARPERFEALDFEYFSLQPLDDDERDAHTREAIAFCLKHPRWRLSLQTHKTLGID